MIPKALYRCGCRHDDLLKMADRAGAAPLYGDRLPPMGVFRLRRLLSSAEPDIILLKWENFRGVFALLDSSIAPVRMTPH